MGGGEKAGEGEQRRDRERERENEHESESVYVCAYVCVCGKERETMGGMYVRESQNRMTRYIARAR